MAVGIHPRNWPGFGNGQKQNTCKPRSIVRLKRGLAGIERHIENHPGDTAARQRAENLKRRMGG